MIYVSEDSLICDLAETYKIYDYKSIPQSTVAVLAAGLPDDSRIKMRLSDRRVSTQQMLLAMIIDELNILAWQNSRKKGRRPRSFFKAITTPEKEKDELMAFSDPEDYEKWIREKRG